jgi:hypothetical protein
VQLLTCVDDDGVLWLQVHSDEEVRMLYRAVAGEVPGSPIFSMKLAPRSRHLEVSQDGTVWVVQ